MTALEIKIAGVIVMLFALVGGLWYVHHAGYVSGQQEVIKADKAALDKAIAANTELINQLEVQHGQNETALTALRNLPPVRVRIPSRYCAPTAAARSTVQVTAAERTDNGSQGVLDEATRHLESKAAEWSSALNNCSVVMEWAKIQQ